MRSLYSFQLEKILNEWWGFRQGWWATRICEHQCVMSFWLNAPILSILVLFVKNGCLVNIISKAKSSWLQLNAYNNVARKIMTCPLDMNGNFCCEWGSHEGKVLGVQKSNSNFLVINMFHVVSFVLLLVLLLMVVQPTWQLSFSQLLSNGFSDFYAQVFIIIHVVALVYYIKGILTPQMFKVAVTLVVSVGL